MTLVISLGEVIQNWYLPQVWKIIVPSYNQTHCIDLYTQTFIGTTWRKAFVYIRNRAGSSLLRNKELIMSSNTCLGWYDLMPYISFHFSPLFPVMIYSTVVECSTINFAVFSKICSSYPKNCFNFINIVFFFGTIFINILPVDNLNIRTQN